MDFVHFWATMLYWINIIKNIYSRIWIVLDMDMDINMDVDYWII